MGRHIKWAAVYMRLSTQTPRDFGRVSYQITLRNALKIRERSSFLKAQCQSNIMAEWALGFVVTSCACVNIFDAHGPLHLPPLRPKNSGIPFLSQCDNAMTGWWVVWWWVWCWWWVWRWRRRDTAAATDNVYVLYFPPITIMHRRMRVNATRLRYQPKVKWKRIVFHRINRA